MSFLALFVSLPTKASTGRMRVWRSVKAQGCATLRDGVYLLPDSADSAATLGEVAAQAVEVGGSGQVYRLSGCDEAQKAALRACSTGARSTPASPRRSKRSGVTWHPRTAPMPCASSSRSCAASSR